MFRRIELIHTWPTDNYDQFIADVALRDGVDEAQLRREWPRYEKTGLNSGPTEVYETWHHLNMPRRRIGRNCRFYWTERGWERYGRATVARCQQLGQPYRVIAVKERSVEIVYRDELQVAVRPRKGGAIRRRA